MIEKKHNPTKGNCQACNRWSELRDRAHIKSKGSGGSMDESNLLLLCRMCHREQHAYGWNRFIAEHPGFDLVLAEKGFEICEEFGIKKLRSKDGATEGIIDGRCKDAKRTQ